MNDSESQLSAHAINIEEEWFWDTIQSPEIVEPREAGTTHYVKAIEKYHKRCLRVILI